MNNMPSAPPAVNGFARPVQELLSAPFDPGVIHFKPQVINGARALAIAYIDARAVMDRLDHAVGVVLHKKVGDAVDVGEPLCTLLVKDESRLREAEALIRGAYTFAEEPAVAAPLIVERIAAPPLASPVGNPDA